MMNPATEAKIRTLFDRYVSNYALYRAEPVGEFVCPLCGTSFSVDDIGTGQLSLAHIIPKVHGGTRCILLCKRCNNKLGGSIEGHADHRKKMYDSLSGASQELIRLKTTVTDRDGHQAVLPTFVRGDRETNTLEMHFSDKTSSPQAFAPAAKTLSEGLAQAGPGLSITFDLTPNYSDTIADLIDYSITYHALFSLMGYEFALSALGASLREMLRTQGEQTDARGRYGYPDDGGRLDPGTVVVVDGVFGVVMPNIPPMIPGRVLFVGTLLAPLCPHIFGPDHQIKNVKIVVAPVDSKNLIEVPTVNGLYHQFFYGITLQGPHCEAGS